MTSAARSPQPSATVMLLREAGGRLEVLMTQRHRNLSFMGGRWVFPGGALHAADGSARTLERIASTSKTHATRIGNLNGEMLSVEQSSALAVAACRETFEEAGVLLAVDAQGRPCSAATMASLQAVRSQVANSPESFAAVLEREQLWLDIGRLVYWAHWITPSREPRRFDTRFFAIEVDRDQVVTADETETTECRWMDASQAIEAAGQGTLLMAPPTLCTLLDLQASHARHGSLPRMLTGEVARQVPPILPKMLDAASGDTVVLPWDAHYASLDGEGAPPHIDYSDCRRWPLSRLSVPRQGKANGDRR